MSETVILIGFEDQGNLGIGYLAAVLEQHGYSVRAVDVRQDEEYILDVARSTEPILIGFSLIFQFYLPSFQALAAYLRSHGITCHFTIGGHYPSLCYEETLKAMPELDSIVRFEGELSVLELVDTLSHGRDWRPISGLAYRDGQQTVATPLRPLVVDLDRLPYPVRPNEPEHVLGRTAAPILGSRGCARTCSFCSIHAFYRSAPGKVVRVRSPGHIVGEMKQLHQEHGITIFLFQDDDFPLWGKPGMRWALALMDELERQELVGRVIWKISCRAEQVELDLFRRLQSAGLYLVYMGLESGTEAGLEVLNKRSSVEQNLRAVMILKELKLMFEYGFMLFDPSSTFASVVENVAFLRTIVGDGSAGGTFCRMLPYGGTPIRERLAREGRLKGGITQPDYDFLDDRLNDYFEAVNLAASSWIHGDGVSHQLNWAWHEVAVLKRLFPPVSGMAAYQEKLRSLTRVSNEALFNMVEKSALAWERGTAYTFPDAELEATCRQTLDDLINVRNHFIAQNQEVLLSSLANEKMSGPIVSPQAF